MLSGVVRMTAAEHSSSAPPLESSPLLRKTAELLENHLTISSYIRRVHFDGYHGAKESALIFGVLHQCKNLEDLLILSTALRHGTIENWSFLFGSNAAGPCIKTLEIRATNLQKRFDNKALESTRVDFTNLACLRLSGSPKFMINDEGLVAIARTANNLRELHISHTTPLGPKGIGALIRSSQLSLEVLELDGYSQMKTNQSDSYSHLRLCQLIAYCPRLRRLGLLSVRSCRDIFACNDVVWSGKVQIFLGANSFFQVPQSDGDTANLYQFLEQARHFMDSRMGPDDKSVEIEIVTGQFIFEPRRALVHGDFQTIRLGHEPWIVEKNESHRHLQMIGLGYVRTFPFRINEDEFKDGLNKGYVWL